MNHEIVIVSATRTALGSFGGSLSSIPAHKLGSAVIASLLEKTGVANDQVDEVILGQVLTAGSGQNPARQAALDAGLPNVTPAMTINKVCGSGLKAVQLAFQAIACGDAEIVIAGGQENMSLSGHVLPKSREGKKMGPWEMVDTMVVDGLWCVFNDYHMGVTAENIASKFDYSRESQDHFATQSLSKRQSLLRFLIYFVTKLHQLLFLRNGEMISFLMPMNFLDTEQLRNRCQSSGPLLRKMEQ